jgi:hypothetical protein
MTYQPKSPAIIDASMGGIEYWYTKLGAEGFAKLIAARLRDRFPHREVLDAVARLLDPQPDDKLKLVLVHHGRGNPTKMPWTKRREDIEIAQEVNQYEMEWTAAGKPSRGRRKKAVGEIAARRKISPHKVLKALKVLDLIPKSNTQFGE